MTIAPPELGRGIVLLPGDRVPEGWRKAPVVEVDEAVLADPAKALASLHEAWATRRPVVIVLAVDAERLRRREPEHVEPWRLGPGHEPGLERLQFLVWANTWDGRGGRPPVWWWARKAERLGATVLPEGGEHGPGDVVLPDGRRAWVDGGPRSWGRPAALGAEVVHRESIELGSLAVAPSPVAPTAVLAPDQLAAVAATEGATRVLAPAGSGKTRVLTERLRHLLVDRGWERETVLAVAYNVRARGELQERCAGLGARVQTLNALGLSLLATARGSSPRVLGERDVRRILDDLVPGRRRRANTDPVAPYIEALGIVRLALRDPAEVEAERDDVPGLTEIFPRYRTALQQQGAVDFDEQVYGAIEALLADPEVRHDAAARCRHLLVDEFQDLTPAHVLLLRLLALPGLEVFGVGDDDQVIYGYNGADPRFLVDYADLFPGAASHPLEVNYRCPVVVVDGARRLLAYNHVRTPKEIRPGPAAEAGADRLRILRRPGAAAAADLVDAVQGWLDASVDPHDIAVLARVNALLLAPRVALGRAGVPVATTLGPEVLDRLGVRAALTYLRIGAEPDAIRGSDVVEIMRRPSRGLPQWFPERLRRRGHFTLGSLRAIADTVPAKEAPKVNELVDDLAVVADEVATGTTASALAAIRTSIGLGRALGLLDDSKGGQTASQLDDLEALEQVAALQPDPRAFEAWLRESLAEPPDERGVTLSSVHRVKGQEWDHVAVVGANGGLLPHRLAEDVEEERRILHVAVTRGRRGVVVLADAARPSPFLAELEGTAPPPGSPSPADRRPSRSVPSSRRASAAAEAAPLSAEEAAIEEALRTWRKGRARADGVAAFIVASNAVLAAIARRRPSSLEELAAVPGIGPTKLELYGDEILAVVEDP